MELAVRSNIKINRTKSDILNVASKSKKTFHPTRLDPLDKLYKLTAFFFSFY